MLGTNTEDEAIMKDLVAMMKGDSQLLWKSKMGTGFLWLVAVDPFVWEAMFVREIWKKTLKTGKSMKNQFRSVSKLT